ncbi:MAG: class I tRNA ligase family protein, partial [Clostridia bacterium]|nr:class I tRNA ligase family protein [Clostridia bacterium]
ARNFANKLWNAARFVLMNLDIEKIELPDASLLLPEDKWILAELNKVVASVTDALDHYEIGIALGNLYDFIWDVYCDWYIELSKHSVAMKGTERSKAAQNVLAYVLAETLKLLHPFMPFITEEIYQSLPGITGTIMLEQYPEYRDDLTFPEDCANIERVIDAIRAIRARRAEMNVPSSRKASLHIVTRYPESFTPATEPFFARLASASSMEVVDSYAEDGAVRIVTDAATVYIPMADIVDFEAERKRLGAELTNTENEIARLTAKLSNENFTSRAPAAVVEGERAKLDKYKAKLEGIKEALAALQ